MSNKYKKLKGESLMKNYQVKVTEEWVKGYNTVLDLLLKQEGLNGVKLFDKMRNINFVEIPEEDTEQTVTDSTNEE